MTSTHHSSGGNMVFVEQHKKIVMEEKRENLIDGNGCNIISRQHYHPGNANANVSLVSTELSMN